MESLATREVNYDETTAPTPVARDGWHVDNPTFLVAHEEPGPPAAGGPWELACAAVRDYEFADPRLVRAVYQADDQLLGRDMLLVGRFFGLRFHMGVRITEIIDVDNDAEQVWGWAYQTLQGHLEEGKLAYEVVKDVRTGLVSVRLRAYSRAGTIKNPLVRLGWRLFGRTTQLRFYAEVGRRLRDTVQAIHHGLKAPAPARLPGGW